MSYRFALAASLFAISAGGFASTCSAAKLGDVEHIIVIYLENHSFDNLFGFFPGADGIATAGATKIQVDADGKPYSLLPQVNETADKVDSRFPKDLPNQPFSIDAYVPIGAVTGDPIHRFFYQRAQIDGGRMDKFVAYTNMGALVMGFYDGSQTKLWEYAQRYTLADHFFHAAFGGTFLNHFWMICACTPIYKDAPESLKAAPDAAYDDATNLVQLLRRPDKVTFDGYAVNTLQPFDPPHRDEPTVPLQEMKTIGDELSDKGVSWAWYGGGWDNAVAGRASPIFQFHHHPFAYFRKYAEGSDGRRDHLKDAKDFIWALTEGQVPQVVFYKPSAELNEHPGYANVLEGDEHLGRLLCKIEQSPIWSKSIVIVTFDENGGYWDHVPPPVIDRWGPGTRVPTVIISPFAKKGFVDHTTYDSTAILKLIETRFNLPALGDRDKKSKDLTNAFDFDGPPPEPVCKTLESGGVRN
ncbi:MAG: acid phosphatase [Methyloceanibacter sp.]